MLGSNVDLKAAWRSDSTGKTNGLYHSLLPNTDGQIWKIRDGLLEDPVVKPKGYPYVVFDQFRDGRWLFANARSDGSGNACTLSEEGRILSEFELGDGIEHVQIDNKDRIWVGWFDEGVFGNDRWRYPGLRWPPSSSGVAAFDSSGQLLMTTAIPGIADCYAMNVFADQIWTCTYTDFPIWTRKKDIETTWETDLSGTTAIAVAEPHVIAAGGYGADANKITLLQLQENGKSKLVSNWDLMSSEYFKNDIEWLSARNDILYAYDGSSMCKWRVEQFL